MVLPYLIPIFLILLGIFLLVIKYRIVVGGILCSAKVKYCEYGASSRYTTAYRMIVGFKYNDAYLQKPSISSTFFPEKWAGRQVCIYYNEKHPNYVVNKGVDIEIMSSLFFILGFVLCYLYEPIVPQPNTKTEASDR